VTSAFAIALILAIAVIAGWLIRKWLQQDQPEPVPLEMPQFSLRKLNEVQGKLLATKEQNSPDVHIVQPDTYSALVTMKDHSTLYDEGSLHAPMPGLLGTEVRLSFSKEEARTIAIYLQEVEGKKACIIEED